MCIHDSLPEEWRPIPGYEGFYSVSSKGRVRRDASSPWTTAGKILKPAQFKRGYKPRFLVSLCKDGEVRTFRTARLVAMAFLGQRPDGYETNHVDGVPSHDCADNLEYVTPEVNQAKATALRLQLRGTRNAITRSVLSPTDVLAIRAAAAAGTRQADLARQYGVTGSTIWAVVHRKSWPTLDQDVDLLSTT